MNNPIELDSGHAALPRLRIYHLFAWMTVAAAMFVLARNLLGNTLLQSIAGYSFVSQLIIESLAVTLIGFGIVWRSRGIPFPCEPGHGLLFLAGLNFIWRFIGLIIHAHFIERSEIGTVANYEQLPQFVLAYLEWNGSLFPVFSGVLSLSCVFWLAKTRRWQFYFTFFAVVTVIEVSVSFLLLWGSEDLAYEKYYGLIEWVWEFLFYGPAIAISTILSLVAFLDYRSRILRHWTHWVGVLCAIATVLVVLSSTLFDFALAWVSYPS